MRIIYILLLLLPSLTLYASERYNGINLLPNLYFVPKPLTEEEANSKIISSIRIEGNTRTSQDVITNNILLSVGSLFDKNLFIETVQNLKNLQIFSKVKVDIYANGDSAIDIVIELSEKWTMLPYFVLGTGGGSSFYALGFYDTNFIGRLYTFNFTYGCKNGNCSSVAFFRNPSLFGSKINYVINPAEYHNVYYIYNKKREIIGVFSNNQDLFVTYGDFPISPKLSLGTGVIYQDNFISSRGLSGDEMIRNGNNHFQMPHSTSSTAYEQRLTLGQINYDGILVNGVHFVSVIDSTLQMMRHEEDNYTSISNTLTMYNRIPGFEYSYFAFRGNLSMTSNSVISQHLYLGGLDKIRGLFDNELFGQFAWYANSEIRIPSYIGDTFALQHVIFSDVGYAANNFPGMFSGETAVSVGTGFRLLFLNINKIAIRLDWAYTVNPFNTYGFSFGLLQFF